MANLDVQITNFTNFVKEFNVQGLVLNGVVKHAIDDLVKSFNENFVEALVQYGLAAMGVVSQSPDMASFDIQKSVVDVSVSAMTTVASLAIVYMLMTMFAITITKPVVYTKTVE